MKKELIPNDVMTDRQLIVRVFNKLRKQGFVALTKAACCQGCASAMLSAKYKGKIPDNVVFFTNQDDEAFDRYGKLVHTLYITHQGDAQKVVAMLVEHGFQAVWPNADPTKRIAVTGRVHIPEPKKQTLYQYFKSMPCETVGARYIRGCLGKALFSYRYRTHDDQKQLVLSVLRDFTRVANDAIDDVKKL